MSLEKLKRTAVREFKRSPAKACVLLTLCPVALYFIVPLVLPSGDKKKAPRGGAQALVSTENPADASGANAAVAARQWSWDEFRAAVDRDPRMTPALLSGARNPFEFGPDLLAMHEEPEDAEAEEEVDVTPWTELIEQLRLTATVVGPHLKLATINGRVYRLDQQVKFQDDAGTAAQNDAITVLKIERHAVVLEHRGQRHRVKLSSPHRNGTLTIRRAG